MVLTNPKSAQVKRNEFIVAPKPFPGARFGGSVVSHQFISPIDTLLYPSQHSGFGVAITIGGPTANRFLQSASNPISHRSPTSIQHHKSPEDSRQQTQCTVKPIPSFGITRVASQRELWPCSSATRSRSR